MASFIQRGKNLWQGEVRTGKKKPNGSYEKVYVYGKTKKECQAEARLVEDAAAKNKLSNLRNEKINDYFDYYLRVSRDSRDWEDNTYINYEMYVRKHFKPYFQGLKFRQVNEHHIADYISTKLKELSPTTVRKHILFMRMVFKSAKYGGVFDEEIVVIPKNAEFKPVIPTNEQVDLIVSTCKLKKHEIICLIAIQCGLRLGEIFALKWDDIDFENKEIHVDQAFARQESKEYGYKEPKSKNGYRYVPCADNILEKLIDYRNDPYKSKRGFLKKNVVSMQIFDGRPDCFSNNFGKRMDRIGLGAIRFHDLRHYYASWLYKNHVADHLAAELMGHDILVLKAIYQHLGLEERKEGRDRVRGLQNNMVFGGAKPIQKTIDIASAMSAKMSAK